MTSTSEESETENTLVKNERTENTSYEDNVCSMSNYYTRMLKYKRLYRRQSENLKRLRRLMENLQRILKACNNALKYDASNYYKNDVNLAMEPYVNCIGKLKGTKSFPPYYTQIYDDKLEKEISQTKRYNTNIEKCDLIQKKRSEIEVPKFKDTSQKFAHLLRPTDKQKPSNLESDEDYILRFHERSEIQEKRRNRWDEQRLREKQRIARLLSKRKQFSKASISAAVASTSVISSTTILNGSSSHKPFHNNYLHNNTNLQVQQKPSRWVLERPTILPHLNDDTQIEICSSGMPVPCQLIGINIMKAYVKDQNKVFN